MAAINYYLADTTSSGWQALTESTNTAATISSGWVVGTGSTNHSEFAQGSERAASTFTGTGAPDGTIDTTLHDCFRSSATLNGTFASGNWEFHFVVRADTNGGSQSGRVRFRLFRVNSDDSAVEITSAQQQGSLVSSVTTSGDFDSTLTFNPGSFSLTDEFVLIQVAWERTGAGGMSSSDIHFRTGSSSSAGTRIITANFTASGGVEPIEATPSDSTGFSDLASGQFNYRAALAENLEL